MYLTQEMLNNSQIGDIFLVRIISEWEIIKISENEVYTRPLQPTRDNS